jgi:hypothetical protein
LLCRAEGAADGAVVIHPPTRKVVAPEKNAHQPPVVTAGDDLTLPSRQASSFHSRNLAHNWHTGLADLSVFCGFERVSTDWYSVRLRHNNKHPPSNCAASKRGL